MSVVAVAALLVLFLTHATCLWLGATIQRRRDDEYVLEMAREREHFRSRAVRAEFKVSRMIASGPDAPDLTAQQE